MNNHVYLSIGRDPALVRTIRLLSASLARLAGLDEDGIEEVRMAVGEACAVLLGAQLNDQPDATGDAEGDDQVVVDWHLAHGLEVSVTGKTSAQQTELADLGLDPWALLRGLREEVEIDTDGADATVTMTWAA